LKPSKLLTFLSTRRNWIAMKKTNENKKMVRVRVLNLLNPAMFEFWKMTKLVFHIPCQGKLLGAHSFYKNYDSSPYLEISWNQNVDAWFSKSFLIWSKSLFFGRVLELLSIFRFWDEKQVFTFWPWGIFCSPKVIVQLILYLAQFGMYIKVHFIFKLIIPQAKRG